ncbi:MAG: hypothetical protein V4463_05320 [Pseudomonadota bacterium]
MDVTLDLYFYDREKLQALGLELPEILKAQRHPALIPATGDAVRIPDIVLPNGEPAIFRVHSRAHLLGDGGESRIQIQLELNEMH